MLAALLLALQSTPVAGPALPNSDRPRRARDCRVDAGENGEVVVCGRPDQDQHRLKPLPDRAEPALPRAETTLFGDTKAVAEVERAGVGGFPSNRIMLRLKLPF